MFRRTYYDFEMLSIWSRSVDPFIHAKNGYASVCSLIQGGSHSFKECRPIVKGTGRVICSRPRYSPILKTGGDTEAATGRGRERRKQGY